MYSNISGLFALNWIYMHNLNPFVEDTIKLCMSEIKWYSMNIKLQVCNSIGIVPSKVEFEHWYNSLEFVIWDFRLVHKGVKITNFYKEIVSELLWVSIIVQARSLDPLPPSLKSGRSLWIDQSAFLQEHRSSNLTSTEMHIFSKPWNQIDVK